MAGLGDGAGGDTRPLKLLFLTQTYPRFGGDTAGPFIRDLARGLVRGGDEVTVLVPHAAEVRPSWVDDGVTVRSFRYAPVAAEVVGYGRSLEADERLRPAASLAAPLYCLGAWRALRGELRRDGYDLLHAHWVVPNGLVAALPGVGGFGVPLAVGLHGSDVFLAETELLRPLVGRTLRRARLLTGCSPELVERTRRLGFEGPLWRVIPYGVDVALFSPGETRRGIWRRRLGISDTAVMVLAVGRLASKKGFHVLADALPRLLAGAPASDVHVVLAGAGDLAVELRAATERFRDRVHLTGAVDRDTLPDLYRAADLFVLPAVHDAKGNVDGLPNVILEAMASGLPVVASDISGIPLAVRSGVDGLLVPEGEAPALAEALLAYVSDGDRRREGGAAARCRVETEMTWDAVALRYREAYVETLQTAAGAHGAR